jgi:hypothetical protein
MSKSDGGSDGNGDGGWLFTMIVFAVGLLLLVVFQERLPALAAMGVILAIIGGLGIFVKLRDIGS